MTAYYNEIDPFAADWLENLILVGAIAPGVVDRRSIEDVTPDDLKEFTQCHFFAGIGVWSHALREAGWRDDRRVWTASCPCQPFSAAGKGTGFDDERHLWPALYHLATLCRPDVIFGEQVASKDGLAWLDVVHSDMEATGHAFGALDLCAAGVGAPHIRQRSFWVAQRLGDTASSRHKSGPGKFRIPPEKARDQPVPERSTSSDDVRLADGASVGRFGRRAGEEGDQSGPLERPERLCDASGLAHAEHDGGRPDEQGRGSDRRTVDGRGGSTMRLDDDDDARPQGHAGHDGAASGRQESGRPVAATSISDGLADSESSGWARELLRGERGLQTDGIAQDSQSSWPGPTNGYWGNADWLGCRDGKWRPVESRTFPLAHGVANRVGTLRGYGNAIVGPLAKIFIETVMEYLDD